MKRLVATLIVLCLCVAPVRAAEAAKVYVILWFDTEDYILPASDDAALRVASFLTREGIPGTFKVVGEKARTLEARKRTDVIDALKKHELGYHANWHSVQPTPAQYLSNLGWDEGVAEFDRREGGGRADVERIFGQAPSCYGQPGSSWGPQSFGAMQKWGMKVYLDGGRHLSLERKPLYYCGTLLLYDLEHYMRADLKRPQALDGAKEKFASARKKILAEGGGVVSIVYHPCEFVHKEFWDGVNFRSGANPARAQWKLPPQMTEEETKSAFAVFEDYVRFMKRFPEVKFITAGEALTLYADRSRREYRSEELKEIAGAATSREVTFQRGKDYALSASEVLLLLNQYVATHGDKKAAVKLDVTPLGPTAAVPVLTEAVTVDASQFQRTAADVADCIKKQGRVPSTVWLGSIGVPPEAYLQALAVVARDLLDGNSMPEKIEVKPTIFGAAKHVSADDPKLWTWVIFPPGFHAPAMMELAKKQAWTIKPAMLAK